MRRKRTVGRIKSAKTIRLLNCVLSTQRFVSPRLPKGMVRFEQGKYRPIVEAVELFNKKDPATTEATLQELCTEYLKIYAPEKL